jgi:hypothetical protein
MIVIRVNIWRRLDSNIENRYILWTFNWNCIRNIYLLDGYVGYGYTSVALGLISTILVYRSFRNAR